MTQNLPAAGDTGRVDDELLIDEEDILTEANDGETIEDAENAAAALEQMQAHERRRDGTYATGGDTDLSANGVKELDRD